MADQTYQKYGISPSDKGIAGLQAQPSLSDNFKSTFQGINNLLKQAEDSYRETNTLNLQEHLKSKVKEAGLSAGPLDLTDVKRKFGSMVDYNKLQETEKNSRDEMVRGAVDDASGIAGQQFGETEDITAATSAFRQSLIKAGMSEPDAVKKTAEWRTDNQYLVEDVALAKNQLIESNISNLYQSLRSSNGELSFEDVAKQQLEGVDPKYQPELMGKLKAAYTDWTALTEDQKAELATVSAQTDNYVAANSQVLDAQIQQLGAQYKAMPGIDEGTLALAGSLTQQFGGTFEAIGKDADNGLLISFARGISDIMPWNWNNDTGMEIANTMHEKAMELKQQGFSNEQATAIGLQAYQNLKGPESADKIGIVIDSRVLRAAMDQLAVQEKEKLQAKALYTKAQESGIKQKLLLQNQAIASKAEWVKKEKFSNISGQQYDTTASFKNSLFGKGSIPKINDTEATVSTKKKTKEGPAKYITELEEEGEKVARMDRAAKIDKQSADLFGKNQGHPLGGIASNPDSDPVLQATSRTTKYGDNGLLNRWYTHKTNKEETIKNNYINAADKKANELKKLSPAKQNDYILKLKKAGESKIYIDALKEKLAALKGN